MIALYNVHILDAAVVALNECTILYSLYLYQDPCTISSNDYNILLILLPGTN